MTRRVRRTRPAIQGNSPPQYTPSTVEQRGRVQRFDIWVEVQPLRAIPVNGSGDRPDPSGPVPIVKDLDATPLRSDEQFGADAEVVRELPDVRQGQVALSPQDHGPKVATPAEKSRKVGG